MNGLQIYYSAPRLRLRCSSTLCSRLRIGLLNSDYTETSLHFGFPNFPSENFVKSHRLGVIQKIFFLNINVNEQIKALYKKAKGGCQVKYYYIKFSIIFDGFNIIQSIELSCTSYYFNSFFIFLICFSKTGKSFLIIPQIIFKSTPK